MHLSELSMGATFENFLENFWVRKESVSFVHAALLKKKSEIKLQKNLRFCTLWMLQKIN